MYRKNLVPLDGSPLAECVFPHVETIAKGCGVPQVVLVRAAESVSILAAGDYDGYGLRDEDWTRIEEGNHKEAETYLKGVAEQPRWSGLKLQVEVLPSGDPADRITNYTAENGVDMIVIATHGRSGVSRWVMGSVAERVLRSSPVPVLVVRSPGCESGV